MALRVSAISFLNPAPLLYEFEHEPSATTLRATYAIHYTTPANCARELHAGAADLGLIPIAELTPELAVVPGCSIASLHEVRSILLLVKNPRRLATHAALRGIRSVAADSASRSSTAYLRVLLEHFFATHASFAEHAAEPAEMLEHADAALIIGDPALMARERRAEIDAQAERAYGAPLAWLDLAALWREQTGLPWVAAVWAVRPEALAANGVSAAELTATLVASRDAGLANIAALVDEWAPRVGLPRETVRAYLTRNIHYRLDEDCLRAVRLFRELAAEHGVLPILKSLRMLG